MDNGEKKEWMPWALRRTNPDIFYFKDDGLTPNSHLPVLVYRGLFDSTYQDCEGWLEKKFTENGWVRTCNKPLFDYYHYHSNTHEVLGVCRGTGFIQLADKNGVKTELEKGDVVLIPAGIGHYCINCSEDFAVVAGYPDHIVPDVLKATPENREKSLENIKNVPIPRFDPILRDEEGCLQKFWGHTGF